MDKLTTKQRAFVEAYLTGQNATEAAIAAGYSEKTARSVGSENLTKPDIASEIASRTQKAVERVIARTDISVERTLEYVGRLAFFDPKELFESDGSLKQIKDISEEARTVLAGLEVTELFEGSGDEKHAYGLLKKVKLADRKGALDMLMRYHSLYKDTTKVDVEVIKRVVSDL